MKYIFILSLIITIITGSSAAQEFSLKQKIGQMLMIGFRDTIVSDSSRIIKDIQEYNIGGVVLYEYDVPTKLRPRNISSKTQLKNLSSALQKHAATPLFIGIDEEGGKVTRLKPKYGFKPTVSALYLGELNNDDSTAFYAKRIAMACKEVGINMNFAPVVDVNINPNCPVIGGIERSFSNNPEVVSHHAQIYLNQHQEHGIFCTLKHFPGHGSAKMDSHKGFTDVSDSWTKNELIPYQNLLAISNFPMVMTSHVFNRNIDSVYPATLSKPTINILRQDLKYNGLILSDDMMMLAIADNFGLEEAIKQSINAGVDILIFSNNIDHYNPYISKQIVDIILALVETKQVKKERIEESYARIIKAKSQIN